MTPKLLLTKFRSTTVQSLVAVLCVLSLASGNSVMLAQQAQPPVATSTEAAPKIPNDQLDALVAPIALYPDPLLSQTLVASTYPLEMIQLQQWLDKHKDLKGDALVAAVKKEKWDPSIQSMAALPDVVKQLAGNISWTTDLGNAFLAQQNDVMDAVQRMRAKANAAGNLKSNAQMKVETKVVETKTVVVIEQADPKVIYVPSYNPVVVYGPPVYPYPPVYYPPPVAGAALAFGVGVAMGAAWGGGGGWGYNCGWGHNDVNVNVNNNYNKTNINNVNKGGNNNWQHNPQHRGAAPYSNKATANQYGAAARKQPAGGASNRPSSGAANTGAGNRPSGGAANTAAARPSGGGANSIGNQSLGGGSGSSSRGGGGASASSRGGGGGGFGGGGGSSARASSSRGGHSMGGGGLSGGGGRGGGGGRRR